MVVHSYDYWLSGSPWIDPMLAWLAIRCAFSKHHNFNVMNLWILVYAVWCVDPPYNGIHWLRLQGKLHASLPTDVSYYTGELLVVILIRISDSHIKEIGAILRSGLDRQLPNSILAIRVCNKSACTGVNVPPSSFTWNRRLAAEVFATLFMSYAAASRIPSMCLGIVMRTLLFVL